MSNQNQQGARGRRDFLKAAAATQLTTSIFTGRLRGANDRISMGFIGVGMQGTSNLGNALAARDQVQVVAVCDVYQPALERAVAMVRHHSGSAPKAFKDFRELLADKSIDAVCISTPDHWHALMTVEACKAGKDVYVEKPACVYLEEGPKMIEAARKYQRVVQGGNMQRSMPTFLRAKEWIQSGILGEITWTKCWAASLSSRQGRGKPPDSAPPPGLDWDMWLGPAPKVPFNQNRWGVSGRSWPTFRYFWDYAGGQVTDWGVHYIDPVHQFLGEPLVRSVVALGGRWWVQDNLQTPDTVAAALQYPTFMMTYELRESSPVALLAGQRGGTAILGTDGYVVVTRGGAWLFPVTTGAPLAPGTPPKAKFEPQEFTPARSGPAPPRAATEPGAQAARAPAGAAANLSDALARIPAEPSDHWMNFFECIRSRQKPVADIEYLVRSTASCLLINASLRAGIRCDLDERRFTVKQPEARPYTRIHYRPPWKLEV